MSLNTGGHGDIMCDWLAGGVDPDIELTEDELYENDILRQMWLDAYIKWQQHGGKCGVCGNPVNVEDIFHAIPCPVCRLEEAPF